MTSTFTFSTFKLDSATWFDHPNVVACCYCLDPPAYVQTQKNIKQWKRSSTSAFEAFQMEVSLLKLDGLSFAALTTSLTVDLSYTDTQHITHNAHNKHNKNSTAQDKNSCLIKAINATAAAIKTSISHRLTCAITILYLYFIGFSKALPHWNFH